MDKDRLKELEIESILEETHYLADRGANGADGTEIPCKAED